MLVYIASPYTSFIKDSIANHFEREDRTYRVERYIAKKYENLENHNTMFYSPIVHCHSIAKNFGLPTEFEFWQNMDRIMISKSDRVEVLMMDGWKESKGVQSEIEYCKEINKPISYIKWT